MARKKILVCLDGTGNDPHDAIQKIDKKDQVEDDSISNVLKLHLLAGGRLDETRSNPSQLSLYYSGAETPGTIFRRALASAFANLEPDRIRKTAYKDLCANYEPGDEIFIFGFSRGAAIARMLASQIAKDGILVGNRRHEANITLLGVWDTVASFGAPNLKDNTSPMSDVVFENGTIAKNIQQAYHLVAVDETRLAFRPTLMNACDPVHEIWFPGVHSDVGGGYNRDGLSDITLSFMLEKVSAHGVHFTDVAAVSSAARTLKGKVVVDVDDLTLKPDVLGPLHEHKRDEKVASVTLRPRAICVTVNDHASDRPPIIHHSVVDRIKGDSRYRPTNLRGVPHQVLQADGSLTKHTGLEDHV